MATGLEKGKLWINSVKIRLKIDLVLHPVAAEGLGNIYIYIVRERVRERERERERERSHDVMGIFSGNTHSDPSSNHGQSWLHFT